LERVRNLTTPSPPIWKRIYMCVVLKFIYSMCV
jgi:hypothetical protein